MDMKDKIIRIHAEDGNLEICPVRQGIIRCRYSTKELLDTDSFIIADNKGEACGDMQGTSLIEGDYDVLFFDGEISCRADKKSLTLEFMDKEGRTLFRELKKEFVSIPVMKYTTGGEEPVVERVKTVDGERNFIKNLREEEDHRAFQGRLYFEPEEDEGLYGFGQAEEGVYDLRGHIKYLYQHNMRIPMPFFVSSKGYGILFDAACLMTFNDSGEDRTYIFFDAVRQLDYYFIAGPSMDRIIEGYRMLTGGAAMLPKWAFGYVQSKEQYYSARELYETGKRYRELSIPIDCVVQDWNTWEEGKWGNKVLDEKRYGDMKEMALKLHELNIHTMISVWPNMNFNTKDHKEFEERGLLLNDLSTYDAFSEEAREIYFRQVKEGLLDNGFDSLWCDSTEPFSGPDWGGEIKREPWQRYMLVGEEHKKYLPREDANAYSLMHAKGIYENHRKNIPEKRILNLTRSGYASGQSYGAMLWSGDTCASWETLRRQITEGLNMGLSGYPYWTLDIGGFFTVGKEWKNRGCGCNNDPTPKWFWKGIYDEGVKDRGYRELYVRWLEFGCFLPMFRSHGTDTPREIWNFGKEGEPFYDAIARFIRLRYRLMPYIYSLAAKVCFKSGTMMRSLLFDFPEDEKARRISSEFMFGESLLVCPVTEPMYFEAGDKEIDRQKVWECYLPKGEGFYDLYDGTYYKGGRSIKAEAELDRMPVFVRAGSIIPMRDGLSFAKEEPDTPLLIFVYPGRSVSFTYYEDEGDGYDYENKAYALVEFYYDDESRTLRVGSREGWFPGLIEKRQIRIILPDGKSVETVYDGGEQRIAL